MTFRSIVFEPSFCNMAEWPLKIPGEPSRVRLLNALTVTDSYVTTLPHAEDCSALLRLVLCNGVRSEFTIHVLNYVLVLYGRLHFS